MSMNTFMFGGESPSFVSMRNGKVFVRIPVVMYLNKGRMIIGMADIVCRNEDDRIAFSESELVVEKFDANQNEGDEESLEFW